MLDSGDGSYRVKKFKTIESAQAYLDAEKKLGYPMPCDAGPDPVYLEDFTDSTHDSI